MVDYLVFKFREVGYKESVPHDLKWGNWMYQARRQIGLGLERFDKRIDGMSIDELARKLAGVSDILDARFFTGLNFPGQRMVLGRSVTPWNSAESRRVLKQDGDVTDDELGELVLLVHKYAPR